MKHLIEINEFTCPFCSQKKEIRVKDAMVDEETGKECGYGVDGWTCVNCGAENSIIDDSCVNNVIDLIENELFSHDFDVVKCDNCGLFYINIEDSKLKKILKAYYEKRE